ncbi:ABC transporter permease [candidate division KSB1 bacterium]
MKKPYKRPPAAGEWTLLALMSRNMNYGFFGDIQEMYNIMYREEGRVKACLWYWRQVLCAVPVIVCDTLYWSFAMFKNYLKIAVRTVRKQKLFSFINISGLGLGLACCLLVALFIKHEYSYDMFHEKVDRIYTVGTSWEVREGRWVHLQDAPAMVGPAAEEMFPEVERATRVLTDLANKVLIRNKDRSFYEERFMLADPGFFDVFSFELIAGDPKTALIDPHSVVLTESTAKKYFGEEYPVGKSFSATVYDPRWRKDTALTVTGIMKDIPENSHIKFNILGSLSDAGNVYRARNYDSWIVFNNYNTYLLLNENTDISDLERKIEEFVAPNRDKRYDRNLRQFLAPLSAMYRTDSLMQYLIKISAIAVIILLVACINFMNLSTARSLVRAREIGIRKVVGARRAQLFKQFIGESILFAGLATVLAFFLAKLLLPVFNSFTGGNFTFDILHNLWIFAFAAVLAVVVGFFAGCYPALFLSRFRPVYVFKSQKKGGSGRYPVRNILVVVQYTVSVLFILATIVLYNQMRFVTQTDLGLDKDQVVNITLSEQYSKGELDAIKNRMAVIPGVQHATYSSSIPFKGRLYLYAIPFDVTERSIEKDILIDVIYCDYDFVETMGIQIIDGRDFSPEYPADLAGAFIVNEPAIEAYDLEPVVGGKIKHSGRVNDEPVMKVGTVVGVMKDFHYQSLHDEIGPMALAITPPEFKNDYYKFISVKLRGGTIPETLDALKRTLRSFAPDDPFEYEFFDETINKLYVQEQKMMRLLSSVSVMAIFIASLGLIGLATFIAEQRVHEIGVRKVLGATVSGIAGLLSRQFLKWVVIANIIAWPVAYFALNTFLLQSYAYRISIGIGTFAAAGFLSLGIAFLTICAQVVKAASTNPVNVLRNE